MPARKRPTPEDRVEAICVALGGLAADEDTAGLALKLEALHPKNNTFPAEVLLGLAADALELSGADRTNPIEYEGIRETYLSECQFSGRTEHHKRGYALRSVALVRAGLTPDLLAEVSGWRSNDLWIWSWFALVIFVRIAAEPPSRRSVSTSPAGTESTSVPEQDFSADMRNPVAYRPPQRA